MTNQETLKLALEALYSMKKTLAEHDEPTTFNEDEAIKSLEEALAKQEQGEPVAIADGTFNCNAPLGTPLYAAPQQRKPLTEEQLIDLWPSLIMHQHTYAFARAIEAAHGIKE